MYVRFRPALFGAVSSPRPEYGWDREVIQPGAFAEAITLADLRPVLLRINHATEVASTGDGTLRLQEDAIGLLAVAYLDDDAGGRELLQAFRAGRCTGGSFMFSLNEVRLEARV